MSYLALARKWRPRNFSELAGQEHVMRALVNALQTGREINLPPEPVREHTAQQWENGAAGIGTTTLREWPALLRMLDRRDPSYRE